MLDLKPIIIEFIRLLHHLKFKEARLYYSEDIITVENE